MDGVIHSGATPLTIVAMARSWRGVALLAGLGEAVGAVDSSEWRPLRADVGKVVGMRQRPSAAFSVKDLNGQTVLPRADQTGAVHVFDALFRTSAAAVVKGLREKTVEDVATDRGLLVVTVALMGVGIFTS
ncbi:hypothetical protein MMPV_003080 [Pyropia vietnamensis]